MKHEMKQEGVREEFLATSGMYENFVERNVVWADMKMLINGWIRGCEQALSNPSEVNTTESLADMQGRIYMCNRFLAIPEEAIEVLEIEEQEQQKEKQNDSSSKKTK